MGLGFLGDVLGPIIMIVLVITVLRQNGTIGQLVARQAQIEARFLALREQFEDLSRVTPPPGQVPAPWAVELRDESPAPVGVALDEEATPEPQPPVRPYVPAQEPATKLPTGVDWERFIGLRLPVWLGAIALCVAGFFFVSYAIESGIFTPELRVLSAAAASLAFLAGAELVRRRVSTGNPAAIASALGAAAIATAYGTVFLATKTYGLAPVGAGFIATAAVSVLAVAIALAYGQVVAMIGILGAYAAPIVYGGGAASAPFLASYLVAVTTASYAIIRYKAWWRLSIFGLLGPALWGVIWVGTPELRAEAYWADLLLISLPLIVVAATWHGWRQDGKVAGLLGLTGTSTPPRTSLIAAVILSVLGFVIFLYTPLYVPAGEFDVLPDGHAALPFWDLFDIRVWQGLMALGGASVALGFVSRPHRALQLPVLLGSAVAMLTLPIDEPATVFLVVSVSALVFGFGALDQFRRLREPALWAAVLAAIGVCFYAVALYKVAGWDWAANNKHLWSLAALVIASGFLALLRIFGPRVANELARSQTYAALGGAITTLASIAVAIEVDPLYFPAASAMAILGLAAVHLRAPVRGLRVLAVVYLVLYGLLLVGAFSYVGYTPPYYVYVFAPDIGTHALILLVLPGLALLAAATLFQRGGPTNWRLFSTLDVVGIAALAAGLGYLLTGGQGTWRWTEMYVVGGPVIAAELALALVVIYLARRFARPVAHTTGLLLAGATALWMLGGFLMPLLQFWPPFEVPGTIVFNVALIALAGPAALLFAIGWLARQDARIAHREVGVAISLFAVAVSYALVVVDIRQAWHLEPPGLVGYMSQPEYYAYSIATLLFGLGLLGIGVVFRHRGARALSFVFVLGAALKVFLFDAAELGGLWRVLSFLLMGLSFLGISWAYARFVFGIGVPRSLPRTEG